VRRSHFLKYHRKTPRELLLAAVETARTVRDLAVEAGAPRAAAAVRRALKSLDGALRHAQIAPARLAVEAEVLAGREELDAELGRDKDVMPLTAAS
jgi:hypothetical protein